MKNYVQPGNTLTLAAPYQVAAGAGLLVGTIFGVANCDAANGSPVEADIVGVFDLAKATGEAWSQGGAIYWDNTAKKCTTTSSGNKLIGAAALAALSGDTIGRVRLNGVTA
jgi:predicted RecA/RadA family phage recombinase